MNRCQMKNRNQLWKSSNWLFKNRNNNRNININNRNRNHKINKITHR